LPDGITFIGNSCFSECQSMEDVNIPAQIETIENDAFYGNAVRTAPILFPSTLKTIGYNAFAYNRMVKNITFSEGLEAIRGSAFSNCNAVESIKLPESLTTLEGNAFEGCDSLVEFAFPASITEVPNYILYHCDKLQKVVLAAGTTSIEYGAFSQCPQLSDINISDMNTLGFVGAYAFENTGFTTMTLPNSITQMDYSTFHSCKQLTSINVPTGIDYVPANFCENCEQLASVTMHDGIRTIRHTAFYGCPTLAAVDLNDKITSIEYNAFRGCASLQLDKLPDSLTYIGSSAFYQCQSLTGALAIPAGVTVIESDAFNTTAITAATLPEGITQMGSGVFAHCKQLATVTLPTDMTRIESYTFQECTSLEQIQIPDGLREVGYGAFDQSGLASITLPDSLSVIESYAFSSTQLREFRVPDGLHGDPGSWTWAYCKQLKTIYLGRNQDYSLLTDFTCLYGCDSLQLLRIYSATPPRCYSYYLNYRQNCVLEVPEDQVELYRQADVWKEFKEVRGFFDGDVLNDLDFAVMQKMYRQLDGAHWKQPWDLTNNHRSMGKWHGVTTVGDYITAIDLSSQGLKGELCDSLFMLSRLETVNLSDNNITGDLGTLLDKMPVNDHVTEVNMKGNALTGDIYPFAIKLPNLERLDLSYNQLTEVSQPIPNDRLANNQFARGFQFVSWQTKQVVDGAPIVDVRPGHAVAIESNTLQTYRHEYGDYGFTFSSLARLQPRSDNNWDYYWELTKDDDNQWNVYKNDWNNYVLHVQKGVPTAYTHANPWWSFLTYILRFDWTDGDVNCDDAVDVADLQSVVYYALNDGKANGMPFNYTTADVNSDNAINVSDIVGSVDYIMSYEEQPTNAREHIYNRAAADVRNLVSHDGTSVVLTNTDVVAALQLTISGATARQLRISDDVRSRFTVAVRDVAGGVRVVVYSPEGRTLAAGMHSLLTGMPAGASITDVRLADSQARYLDVALDGTTTSLSAVRTLLQTPDAVVYDLSGRRMGSLDSLPEGIYLINVNGKQYKVAIK
ncbi:MAG: leucine-rich repeat protein, partial [Prevotella sp.]|nr:leucine-rich repeat protein [Prevotella sp.]